jgi:hypothetical protein
MREVILPEGSDWPCIGTMLFMPGHYDIIYKKN